MPVVVAQGAKVYAGHGMVLPDVKMGALNDERRTRFSAWNALASTPIVFRPAPPGLDLPG